MLIVFVDCYSSSWYIYTEDVSVLKIEHRAIFEVWTNLRVCHAPLCSIFEREWLWGSNPEHIDHFCEQIWL